MRKALVLAFCVAAATGSVGAIQTNSVMRPAEVAGLAEPVEVLRDRWGINHIFAKSEADLFSSGVYGGPRSAVPVRAVAPPGDRDGGRNSGPERTEARHRHAAAHVPRRPEVGAELVSPARRGDHQRLRPRHQRLHRRSARSPATLPIEFKMLGIAPAPWTPEVVISRHNGLLANIGQELNMAQAVRVLGAEKVKDMQYFQGGDPDITPDPAIDLSLLNASILELYNAFRRPIVFGAETRAIAEPERAGTEPARRGHRQQQLGGQRQAHAERLPADDERPAPRPGRAVAALLGAPGRAGMERDRRRGAGAARRLDRPQRVRRLGPDDLRRPTPRTSTSTRPTRRTRTSTGTAARWEDMRSSATRSGEGRRRR